MRAAVLILPFVLAGCNPAPQPQPKVPAEKPSPVATPLAKPSQRPCIDTSSYDTCLVGKRGTPDKPCFEITAFLRRGIERRAVYAEPDTASRRLGYVLGWPRSVEHPSVPFEVKDSRDGWLLIEGAADNPDLSGVDRPMYHGRGWIRGEGVEVGAHTTQAFTKPDFASEIAVEGEWFDGMTGVAILGCDGSWVHGRWELPKDAEHKIRYRPDAVVSRDPLVVEGWVTGVCPVMETTCDGLGGNRPGTGYDSFVP